MNENIAWQIKAFKDLTVDEFYEIIYLRTAIFVVEQNCPYQEVDEKDKQSYHLFGTINNGEIIAVTRILPQGISYDEISIGRVALKKEYRGKGIADNLMVKTLQFIETQFGKQAIRISAQKHLINYYGKYGFKQVGEDYLEDNIPHIEMIKKQ